MEKYNFEIWENHHSEEFSSGLFVFQTFMALYKFCREEEEVSYLKWTNFWYQNYRGKITLGLFKEMQNILNQDCIAEIAKYLDVVGFCDLFGAIQNEALKQMARRKFANLIINSSTVGERFYMLNFHYILLSIGQNVMNVTVSLRSFRSGTREKWNSKLKYAIIHCICNLASNVRSVTLENFNIEITDSKLQPLFGILNARNVFININ